MIGKRAKTGWIVCGWEFREEVKRPIEKDRK